MRFHRIDYARIEREAISRGVSMEKLSIWAGLAPTTLTNAINRGGRIRPETVHKVAELLGCEPTDLLIPIDPDADSNTKEENRDEDHPIGRELASESG